MSDSGHLTATTDFSPRWARSTPSTWPAETFGARIHLFGVAYKPNVNDVRESPALDIAQLLQQRGAVVGYSDPFVPEVRHGSLSLTASELPLVDV